LLSFLTKTKLTFWQTYLVCFIILYALYFIFHHLVLPNCSIFNEDNTIYAEKIYLIKFHFSYRQHTVFMSMTITLQLACGMSKNEWAFWRVSFHPSIRSNIKSCGWKKPTLQKSHFFFWSSNKLSMNTDIRAQEIIAVKTRDAFSAT